MEAGRYVYFAPAQVLYGPGADARRAHRFLGGPGRLTRRPAGCFGVARSDSARLGSEGRSHGRDFHGRIQLWSCALASDGITTLARDVMGQVHFLQYAPGSLI